MKPQQIIEKAEQLRQREKDRLAEEGAEQRRKILHTTPKAPSNPHTIHVFHALFTAHRLSIFLVLLGGLIYGTGIVWVMMYDDATLLLVGIAIGLAITLLVFGWLWWRFLRFQTWLSRVPFAVNGWQQWIQFDDFKNHEQWRSCNITLMLNASYPEKLVDSLMFLWMHQLNKQRYVPDRGEIPIWTQDGLCLKGFANASVARVVYHFIIHELVPLHLNRTLSIQEIVIETAVETEYFPFPSSD